MIAATRGWTATHLNTPGRRWAAVLVAVLVGLQAVALVVDAFESEPSGPPSSSYATVGAGFAAWASLLERADHPVERLRRNPTDAGLDPGSTLVAVDVGPIGDDDVAAIERFVREGGRLVTGGREASGWVGELLEDAPTARSDGPEEAAPLGVGPETQGVAEVRGEGGASLATDGDALPLLGAGDGSVLSVAEVGDGRVLLLGDSSPLTNDRLDEADNAALALGLAGEAERPVVFAEVFHGYGAEQGLGALPDRVKWALAGLLLALVAGVWSRARRLGPPVPEPRAEVPPRRAHLEAVAASLVRAGDPGGAMAPVRARARATVLRRAGFAPDAPDAELLVAAERLGLGEEDRRVLVDPAPPPLAAARVLARTAGRTHDETGGRR